MPEPAVHVHAHLNQTHMVWQRKYTRHAAHIGPDEVHFEKLLADMPDVGISPVRTWIKVRHSAGCARSRWLTMSNRPDHELPDEVWIRVVNY